MIDKKSFLEIATEMIGRGFAVTPVSSKEKRGVFWGQYGHPARNLSEVIQLSKDYPTCEVGIVSSRCVNSPLFLDIDGRGVLEQIESETGRKMPLTFTVQTRPQSKPWKKHFYFSQTPFSYSTFKKEITGIKDLSGLDADRKYPNRYDVKGIGGGGYVVAPGSMRENGEVYTTEHDGPIIPIPDWLVTWLVQDVHKYRSQMASLREAEKKKHLEAMEARSRTEPLPEYSKDEINIFLWNRAVSFAPLGVRREDIERSLAAQMEDFMKDGQRLAIEWKDRIHDISFDPNLRIGTFAKAYLGKLKRPLSIKAPEPISQPGQIIIVPTRHRYQIMDTEIANFPSSILASEVYTRLGKAVTRAGLTLYKDIPADQAAVQRAMRKATYGCRNIGGASMWAKSFKTAGRREAAPHTPTTPHLTI
jgi:Bifunctional DNA primase/polymerase, N-terminal